MSGYLTMQGKDGVRIWVHDGLYRIQKHRELSDKSGKKLEVWESHQEDGQVKMFGSWQEAEQHIKEKNIT